MVRQPQLISDFEAALEEQEMVNQEQATIRKGANSGVTYEVREGMDFSVFLKGRGKS